MTLGSIAIDFSEKAVFTGPLPCFSPDGRVIALAQEYRVVVRDVETLAVEGVFSCLDRVDAIAWSSCGDLILCGMYSRGTAQVFRLSDPEWSCSITEALAGIACVRWCPSRTHVLLTSDFQVRMSLWSLVDQSCIHLDPPKHPEAGLAFSPDGSTLAVLERSDCKDWLALYNAATWALQTRVALPTADAADLSWSPDSACVACWESLAQGPLVAVLSASGECLAVHRGDSHGLGFKSAAWSPSGQLLALGSAEQDVSVLNYVTWSPLATYSHGGAVDGPAAAVAYKEELEEPLKASENGYGGGAGSPVRQRSPDSKPRSSPPKNAMPGRSLPAPPRRSLPQPLDAPLARTTSLSSAGSSSRSVSPVKLPLTSRAGSGPLPSKVPTSSSFLRGRGGPATAAAEGRNSRSNSLARAGSADSAGGGGSRTRKPPLSTTMTGGRQGGATLAKQMSDVTTVLDDTDDAAVSSYEALELPLRLPAVPRPLPGRPNSKAGVGLAAWSADGSYLATRCDDRPNVLWIWDSTKLSLAAVVIQAGAVRAAEWDPSGRPRLAIVCGSRRVYFWTPEGASCARIPVPGLRATTVRWRRDGSTLLLASRDAMACAYL